MLSVIVPVYQSEKYLERCVESIKNQDFREIEIILVDDGSTDNSYKICDKYAELDNRIKVVHQENKGSFQARRKGVSVAKGDYVTFVDGDDWIEKHTYSCLMNIVADNKIDVISYGYIVEPEYEISTDNYAEGLYVEEEISKEIIPTMIYNQKTNSRDLSPSLCTKVLKKELFEEICARITENIGWGDDGVVTYSVLCIAKKVFISHETLYHYCVHSNSLARSYDNSKIDDLINVKKHLIINVGEEYQPQIDCYVRSFLDTFLWNRLGILRALLAYSFPYYLIEKGCKVKIYGAGKVGQSYYYSLFQSQYAEVVGWYDAKLYTQKYVLGYPIDNPSEINEKKADYIIIAIENENIATDIRNQLESLGVEKGTIIWEKPVRIA